jgi:signal peptidase I
VTSVPPGREPDAPTLHDATLVAPRGPDTEPGLSPSPSSDGARPKKVRKVFGITVSDRAFRIIVEWTVLILAALAIAFLIKTFLFQAFYIPSASMEPTLKIGDRVLVNKLSYDFHDVHRGDIVVFKAPPSAQSGGIQDLVKRVIGLPGDTVTGRQDGSVYINGRRLSEPYLPKGTPTDVRDVPPGCGRPSDGNAGCVVPAGTVLVLGDNRTESKDGRVFGPIKQSSIVGRVFIRIWPLDSISFL